VVGTLGINFFAIFFREPPKIPSKGKKKEKREGKSWRGEIFLNLY
jgi:hypothetical protein